MKKLFKRIACLFGALAVVFSLASCSSISKIKKAFEAEDYKWETLEVSEEAKENGVDGLYSASKTLSFAIIVEFSAKDANELVKKIKEEGIIGNDLLDSILSKISDSAVVNGNCLILTLSSSAQEIFKNA